MIRLLIADDHPVVRQGLRRILTEAGDINVVGEAEKGDDVVRMLESTPVDVLLLDISMPGPTSFLDLLKQVSARHPRLRALVLSMHSEDQYALRAFKAGASGYLTKDRPPEELLEAVRRIHAGGKYVSSALAEKLVTGAQSAEHLPHESLSDREYEVLCLLAAGKSIKEIAARLTLSPKTVSTYRARILEKMVFSSNADIVRYFVEHSLG